jgi:fibronectin-binding autotransporter adhesin
VVAGNFGSGSLPLELDSLGGISQANGAILTTSTLTGNAGGQVTLLGSNNAIGSLGNFQVSGGSNHFALFDDPPLVISGTVTAPGQVYIASSDVGGVTIAAAGSVGAGTLASFQADLFVNNGSVTGATFELAPNTAGSTLNLGSGGGIASLTGIGTTNAELGGVTVPGSGFTITAGAINTVGTFDGNALPVAFRTSGTIGEGASAPIVNVTTLTGSAGGTVALTNSSNAIPTLGSFNVTGGSSDFDLADSVALTVAGPVSAGRNVYLQTSDASGVSVTGSVAASGSGIAGIQADAISITGTVTGGTVELAPNSAVAVTLGGAGGLSLSQATLSKVAANTLRIGAVTVPGAGLTTTSTAISIAGAIDLSGITTTLDLQSNGGVSETGQLNNVGTLTGKTGTVALTKGTDSGIATIGDYTVTGGGDFLMANESSTGVAGTLAANNVSIVEGGVPTSMTITGTVAAAGTANLRSGTVTLATTANVQGTTITLGGHSIVLNGNAVLGKAAQTSVLDMTADATGIT